MPKDTRWDRHLSVAADGDGLIGHAGAVLLRKLADHTVNRGTGPGYKISTTTTSYGSMEPNTGAS